MSTTTTTGTLAAGSSKTFTLAPGAAVSLTLSPNVRVTITESPESVSGSGVGGNTSRVHEPQLPGTFAYGPYAMGGVVVVAVASNSGSSVAWTRKDTVVTTDSTGTSLVSGDGTTIYLGGVLAQQNTEVLAPTDTVKNVLFTCVIPAGFVRANDSLRITHNWICDNNANVKTTVFDFNGGAAASFSTTALTNSASQRGIWTISNRNSLAAQVADASLGFIGAGTTAPTSTIDFAVQQTLTIALTKATGADQVKLMRCIVEILRGV